MSATSSSNAEGQRELLDDGNQEQQQRHHEDGHSSKGLDTTTNTSLKDTPIVCNSNNNDNSPSSAGALSNDDNSTTIPRHLGTCLRKKPEFGSPSKMLSCLINSVRALALTLLSLLRRVLCFWRRNKTSGGFSEIDRSQVRSQRKLKPYNISNITVYNTVYYIRYCTRQVKI